MAETVQEDLGLTADQIEKIKALFTVAKERWREWLAKLRETLPPRRSFPQKEYEVRERKFRALQEDLKREKKEWQAKVLAILTPRQGERLKQIQLWEAIGATLARPEITKSLAISQKQHGTIRAVCDLEDKKLLAEWPDLRGLSRNERCQKMIGFARRSEELNEETMKSILEILTPEQRAKLDKLLGKRIEVRRPYEDLISEDLLLDDAEF
jgi:Spy/CpxP family protein refolding chaperone